ncbi:hypothetical protein PPACK8108_LOCUS23383, partial [Phakopsora pachyrhizi]
KNGIDEEEAELYDRQIRLWGVEAQNRMRKSSVLIVNLKGLASEVCKNLVLAGIKSLTIVDDQDVSAEDLGAGFFFRENDIGKKRVDVALERVKSLNPRVNVSGIAEDPIVKVSEPVFVDNFNVVCLTESDPILIAKVNSQCRKAGKKFCCAASLGISGYIFVDFIEHAYLGERLMYDSNNETTKVTEMRKSNFIPFEVAIKSQLYHIPPRRKNKVSSMLWAVLTLFEYQNRHKGKFPSKVEGYDELVEIAKEILKAREIDEKILPVDLLKRLVETSNAEFAPTCSIIGSVLSQEILNSLGAHQSTMVNMFVFDGQNFSGDIYALGVERT